MGKVSRTLILAMAALAVASCTEKEPEIINDNMQDSKVCLKISDVAMTELTKSAINGESFPTDEDVSIGIFLRETEGHIGSTGSREYDYPYANIKFTRAAGQTEWVPEKEIMLASDTVCVVYAYYPWKEGTISDHIDVYPSVGGDDWMWATPIENVSAAKYSYFSFRGGVHFPNGKMTDNNTLSADINYPLKDGIITADCLLVPAGTSSSRQNMTISCTLAGKNYTANLSGTNGVTIKQGVKSTVSLNIKGSTMEVASVGIGEWSSGETISETLE